MNPILPPESGDSGMWGQIADAAARVILAAVLWIERMLPVIVPAWAGSYLLGRGYFKYRGAALRIFVATGVIMSCLCTPVALRHFELGPEMQSMVSFGIGALCYRIFDWLQSLAALRLGVERRKRYERSAESEDRGDGA